MLRSCQDTSAEAADLGELGATATHPNTPTNNRHPAATATSGQRIPDELLAPLDMYTNLTHPTFSRGQGAFIPASQGV